MNASVLLRPVAASALLFAAACGGSGSTADGGNDSANEALATLGNEALDGDELPNDIDLVDLPEAPADAPAAETAPLTQAAAIMEEIDDGAGVERIPYEGGWAWRRDGRIVRTASRDGRRVSYFRPGDSTPFLVQQGEETFAYAGGRPQRAFDRRGRPGAVSPQRQAEARRLADESRRDRDRAEQAPRPDRDWPGQAPRRPENDSAGPSRGVDDPRRGGGERPGAERPDRGTDADRNERGGARAERGPGNRGDEDRRQRGSDAEGNRQ
ncbi:MAG TPA: hypothetical protein VMG08_09565 [Allosphingosinicella sp.]|nr:hypothetical protein [Allosphingosinicella sp.]